MRCACCGTITSHYEQRQCMVVKWAGDSKDMRMDYAIVYFQLKGMHSLSCFRFNFSWSCVLGVCSRSKSKKISAATRKTSFSCTTTTIWFLNIDILLSMYVERKKWFKKRLLLTTNIFYGSLFISSISITQFGYSKEALNSISSPIT